MPSESEPPPSEPLAAPQADLRAYTAARIAFARTGSSLTTRDALAFTLAHAQARDAVHASVSLPTLLAELHARTLSVLTVKSAASDRSTYIRRPDLGRRLSEPSRALLQSQAATPLALPADPPTGLTIILADGLSALATDRHALPLLDALLPLLNLTALPNDQNQPDSHSLSAAAQRTNAPAANPAWQLTPIILAEQARVALGDEIGLALHSSLTLMLLGERPGLSAADSLGAYLTWAPAPGRTDAQRNCVSNIRPEGLAPAAAAETLAYLLAEAKRRRLSGTQLKDERALPMPGAVGQIGDKP